MELEKQLQQWETKVVIQYLMFVDKQKAQIKLLLPVVVEVYQEVAMEV